MWDGIRYVFCLCIVIQFCIAAGTCDGPGLGACTVNDSATWKSYEFSVVVENLRVCGLESFSDKSISRNCLIPKSKMSENCLECQVNLIDCVGVNCPLACLNGGQANPTCVACAEGSCNPTFVQRTGFSFPVCNDCVQPYKAPKTIVPGLQDGAFFGIIAAGGVALFGISGYTYWKGHFCDRDEPSGRIISGVSPIASFQNMGSMQNMNGSPTMSRTFLFLYC